MAAAREGWEGLPVLPRTVSATNKKKKICSAHQCHITNVQGSLDLFYLSRPALANNKTKRVSFHSHIRGGMAKNQTAR